MAPPIAADDRVHCVADVNAVLGEGPVWVEAQQALYWLDIKGRKIFRVDAAGELAEWPTPCRIGAIAPRRSGGFIAATEHGFAQVDIPEATVELLLNPEEHLPDNRFNDGKTDPYGRFWSGTMDDREKAARGALYRLDPDFEWQMMDGGYRVTNGPAFDAERGRMYHNDSALQTIYLFDYAPSGEISNRRVFAQFGGGDGYPDGMTVDCQGMLWVCFWDGWCLRRFSPDGEVVERIDMPVQRPTSCTFGGPALDRLYVTSATIGLDKQALEMQPCAGGLFLMETGARGVPQAPFAG